MSIREAFSNSIELAVVNELDKECVMQISTVLMRLYNVACRGNFLGIYLTTFSESLISKIQNL